MLAYPDIPSQMPADVLGLRAHIVMVASCRFVRGVLQRSDTSTESLPGTCGRCT